MSARARFFTATAISGLFLLLDRWFKYMSLGAWSEHVFFNDYLGWLPFQNPGIAFGLPLPYWLTILFTTPFIVIVALILMRGLATTAETGIFHFSTNAALLLILFGAVSNLIDRLFYHATLDYFLIITTVINLADVMIVTGFAILLLSTKKTN